MQRDWSQLQALATQHGCTLEQLGIVLVDHGSRRADSNRLLEEFAAEFAATGPLQIVEPAHMELAEPSLRTAFQRCVNRGARLVIVSPFFLLPGRHWTEDIPALAASAASDCRGIHYLVAAPLGPHPLLSEILWQRVEGLR